LKQTVDCADIINQLGISSERFEAWKTIHIVHSKIRSMNHQPIGAAISMENPVASATDMPVGENARLASAHLPNR